MRPVVPYFYKKYTEAYGIPVIGKCFVGQNIFSEIFGLFSVVPKIHLPTNVDILRHEK